MLARLLLNGLELKTSLNFMFDVFYASFSFKKIQFFYMASLLFFLNIKKMDS
jgi:hypothetical protein